MYMTKSQKLAKIKSDKAWARAILKAKRDNEASREASRSRKKSK